MNQKRCGMCEQLLPAPPTCDVCEEFVVPLFEGRCRQCMSAEQLIRFNQLIELECVDEYPTESDSEAAAG